MFDSTEILTKARTSYEQFIKELEYADTVDKTMTFAGTGQDLRERGDITNEVVCFSLLPDSVEEYEADKRANMILQPVRILVYVDSENLLSGYEAKYARMINLKDWVIGWLDVVDAHDEIDNHIYGFWYDGILSIEDSQPGYMAITLQTTMRIKTRTE